MSNAVLTCVVSNTLFACALALLALVVARLWRNPHVTHTLWLLVLLKLVTPPVVEIPVPAALRVGQSKSLSSFSVDESHSTPIETTGTTHGLTQPSSIFGAGHRVTASEAQPFAVSWPDLLLSGWFVGTIIFIVVALRSHTRFSHLVAESHSATTDLVDDANCIAAKMGLAAFPQVRTTTACVSPLVTSARRQRVILLPRKLLAELSRDQTRTVLAHELAHIRRRDHLIQLLKFSILAVHWWNPLAWLASRQLEHCQEECCDAWVVWALPDHRCAYGKTLLQTVEFLTERRPLSAVSETFMARCNLERRIEMVLKQTVPRSVSRRTMGVALVAGLVFLPTTFTLAVATEPTVQASKLNDPADRPGDGSESDSGKKSDVPAVTTADLPHLVEFEQGATRFLDGDEIAIVEVRGTAKNFEPGHIYRIKGRYKLASHDTATIAAYTTATNASDGKSRSLKVQHMSVERGQGEFTLFLPMSYQGWPHVSFYPNSGGEGFGGNYFGTGEFALKKWWGDDGKKPDATDRVITLDKVSWTDAPELRHRLGAKIFDSLSLGIVARVEGYDGDWDALKRHQAASGSVFRLEAERSPTLKARMRSGGITLGSREAWVLLNVEGRPSAGVEYTLRVPDSNWVVVSSVPAR